MAFPGGLNPDRQYYTAQRSSTARAWQWIINTKNLNGVCYVVGVRNQAPPGGGSISSCPAMPPNDSLGSSFRKPLRLM
jgi:hypothetical protein